MRDALVSVVEQAPLDVVLGLAVLLAFAVAVAIVLLTRVPLDADAEMDTEFDAHWPHESNARSRRGM